MVNYLELPVGERAPEVFRAVIEIPKGGTQKFEYDKQLHVFKLDRNLHSPVHYPGDYGFIPSTLSDDGDPLDVLVLVPSPSFPGCVQEVRPIGLLEMLDQGMLDEKVLAVGKNNPRFTNIWNYTDIYPHLLKEITHFFSIYKDLEGKRVEMKGWHDAAYARDRVMHAAKQFTGEQGKQRSESREIRRRAVRVRAATAMTGAQADSLGRGFARRRRQRRSGEPVEQRAQQATATANSSAEIEPMTFSSREA